MEAILSTFSKKSNSSARPEGGRTFGVYLKEGTSVLNPVLKIKGDTNLKAYNYAYIPDFKRYYFVQDASYNPPYWELSLTVDALSSWRDAIDSTKAFVLYDTAKNTELPDKRISTVTKSTVKTSSADVDFLGSATVIISVVGKTGVDYYAVTRGEAAKILSNIDDSVFDNIKSRGNELLEELDHLGIIPADEGRRLDPTLAFLTGSVSDLVASGSAASAIRSAILLPVKIGAVREYNPVSVYLGNLKTNQSWTHAKTTLRTSVDVAINWLADDWRRNNPYHRFILYLPHIGNIEIAPANIMGQNALNIKVNLDIFSGGLTYIVSCGGVIIGRYCANIASPYSIGAAVQAPITPMIAAMQVVSGVATGNIGGIIQGITDSCNLTPMAIGNGGGGTGGEVVDPKIVLCTIYHDTNTPPDTLAETVGTPAMSVKTLSSCRGFVQCYNASISGDMTASERDIINNYLNGGFFHE